MKIGPETQQRLSNLFWYNLIVKPRFNTREQIRKVLESSGRQLIPNNFHTTLGAYYSNIYSLYLFPWLPEDEESILFCHNNGLSSITGSIWFSSKLIGYVNPQTIYVIEGKHNALKQIKNEIGI